MGIIIFDEERFTEKAKNNLEHFIYYVDGNEIAGLVSENCVVYAEDGLSQEEALESIKNDMHEALSGMPDFGAYVMDDGCGLVYLNGLVNALIEKEVVNGSEEIPYGMAYDYRQYCLEAADEGTVIAMYVPE